MEQHKFNTAVLSALSMILARQEFLTGLLMESVAVGNPEFLNTLRESHATLVEESSREWLERLSQIHESM